MITTFLFDIGNVVWDYLPLQRQVFLQWALLSGLDAATFGAKYTEFYAKMETNEKKLSDFVKYINQSEISPYLQVLDQIYNSPQFENYFHRPVVNLISNLRSSFRVGYLSNAENYYYPYIHQKLEPMFDFGYTSWQLKLRKPDPQIYQAVLTLQNLKPEEVVFIDDTPKNVDSAKSLGIESILFTDNAQFLNSLKLLEI